MGSNQFLGKFVFECYVNKLYKDKATKQQFNIKPFIETIEVKYPNLYL